MKLIDFATRIGRKAVMTCAFNPERQFGKCFVLGELSWWLPLIGRADLRLELFFEPFWDGGGEPTFEQFIQALFLYDDSGDAIRLAPADIPPTESGEGGRTWTVQEVEDATCELRGWFDEVAAMSADELRVTEPLEVKSWERVVPGVVVHNPNDDPNNPFDQYWVRETYPAANELPDALLVNEYGRNPSQLRVSLVSPMAPDVLFQGEDGGFIGELNQSGMRIQFPKK